MLNVFSILFVGLAGLAFAYVVAALCAVTIFRRRLGRRAVAQPWVPATLLKPLHGDEFELLENLRSFCVQEGGDYQIVFGVRDPDDPAIAVVERIRAEFPERDIDLVVDPRVIGANRKVSNLANMASRAKHDLIVVSDSDMRVGPDYLATVIGAFADPAVGAATCLYRGQPRADLPSRLGAMFINEWFLPSALIPAVFGRLSYCFGATMAVRREALSAIGSFETLANLLADDYMLGNLVARQGFKVALVPYLVENVIVEPSVKDLFLHELRWARTMRSVQPVGYALSSVTEMMPLAAIAAVLLFLNAASALPALGLCAVAVILRVALQMAVCTLGPARGRFFPWLIPFRDLLSLAVRVISFFGNRVLWRDAAYVIHEGTRFKATQ